jgi:hypothetical protein
MLLIVTVILVLVQFALALLSPPRFVYFCLWTLTIPYWWNFDVQLMFDTPLGRLNIIAIQLFGFIAACLLIIIPAASRAIAEAKLYKWHLAFLFFCGVSAIYAPSSEYAFRMLAKLFAPFLFMLVVLDSIRTQEQMRKAGGAILGSGIIVLALALLAKATGVHTSGLGTLGPPGMGPAVFCAHMLPVSMLAVATAVGTRKSQHVVLAVACALAIIATLQRTSVSALFIGSSVLLLLSTRGVSRFVLPVCGLVGLPALFLFNDSFRNRMFFQQESAQAILADPSQALASLDTSGRSELWARVLQQFFEPHPAVGSGVGATQNLLYSANGGVGVVHSEYVRMLCEVGVIGLSLFAVAALSYLIRLAQYAKSAADTERRILALAALGSLLAYLIYFATDNGIDYVSQCGIYVFALIALAQNACFRPASATTGVSGDSISVQPFPNLLR